MMGEKENERDRAAKVCSCRLLLTSFLFFFLLFSNLIILSSRHINKPPHFYSSENLVNVRNLGHVLEERYQFKQLSVRPIVKPRAAGHCIIRLEYI